METMDCLDVTIALTLFFALYLTVPDECGIMTAIAEAAGGSLLEGKAFNVYDVTTFDPYGTLSHVKNGALENSTNSKFFNDARVKRAIHAPEDTMWLGCIPGSGRRRRRRNLKEYHVGDQVPPEYYPDEPLLEQDRPISMAPYIAELLDDAKIDVLVYNGDRDMACCAQGSEAVLDTMEWNGAEEWKQAERSLWVVNDGMAGYVKSAGNLTFNICFNSGHMFPTNQPVHALDLVTRFLLRQSFADKKTPDFAYYDPNSLLPDDGQQKSTSSKTVSTNESDGTTAATKTEGMAVGKFWFQHVLGVLVCFGTGILVGIWLAGRRQKRLRHEYTEIIGS